MIRKADNVITGADRRLKLYFYYSRVSGKNIVRGFTSLTGERVKKDAAFKGFRESGNRMKEASPIAAALYKMVPAEIKQYALYRLLTGEALKMLKAGSSAKTITKTLEEIYINPLLQEPARVRVPIERTRRENRDNVQIISNITKHFPIKSQGKSRIRRWRRHFTERPINSMPGSAGTLPLSSPDLLKKGTILLSEKQTMLLSKKEKTPAAEQTTSTQKHQISIIANTHSTRWEQGSKFTTKYPELMYRGRLRECKRLRLYIRSSHFPGASN